MSFDNIFDLTAGVYFYVDNIWGYVNITRRNNNGHSCCHLRVDNQQK